MKRKRKIAVPTITPATHTSFSSLKLARCIKCGTQTTGKVKDSQSRKTLALCTNCASAKGF